MCGDVLCCAVCRRTRPLWSTHRTWAPSWLRLSTASTVCVVLCCAVLCCESENTAIMVYAQDLGALVAQIELRFCKYVLVCAVLCCAVLCFAVQCCVSENMAFMVCAQESRALVARLSTAASLYAVLCCALLCCRKPPPSPSCTCTGSSRGPNLALFLPCVLF
jgi:hypothetical protein